MSSIQPSGNQPTKTGDCGCNDPAVKDTATQASIKTLRDAYCKILYSTEGEVSKQETKFDCESSMLMDKKCIFTKSEDNYRRYRNFEIITGSELNQTNDSIKANVSSLKDWNKSLNTLLVNISKQVKDLKAKFTDLKDSACKLETSYNDSCNIGQRKVLTGTTKEKCNDTTTVIDACKNADKDITQLICIPKGLAQDADSIFQVGSDVIGIQLFSNIDVLDQLQKDLATKSTTFDTTISTAMKAKKTDLDKLQDDLVTSVKALTKAAMDRNWQRALFEGYRVSTKFLCCPECGAFCPPPVVTAGTDPKQTPTGDCTDDCPPLLRHYVECICVICGKVQTTFCCKDPEQPPTPPPPPRPKECN